MPLSILLTSESPVKIQSSKKFFEEYHLSSNQSKVLDFNTAKVICNLPPQPYNCGYQCVNERIKDVYSQVECSGIMTTETFRSSFKYIVSIENSITERGEDICYVAIVRGSDGKTVRGESFPVLCTNPEYIEEMKKGEFIRYSDSICGYNITLGEIIHKYNKSIDPKDWAGLYDNSITKEYQIIDGIKNAFEQF